VSVDIGDWAKVDRLGRNDTLRRAERERKALLKKEKRMGYLNAQDYRRKRRVTGVVSKCADSFQES
jgi:hypothetical protein